MRFPSFGIVALAVMLACVERPWHGTVLDPPAPAPPLLMTAGDGSRFSLAEDARDAVVLLYFGYTHCPDVCPTSMVEWARSRRALGADTTGVRYLFLSVDPPRDTPAKAEAYVRQFDHSFRGFGVSDEDLPGILKAWGIAAYAEGDPRTPDYTVAHPGHTFVVDRAGRLRLMIPAGVSGDRIAEDIRRLR